MADSLWYFHTCLIDSYYSLFPKLSPFFDPWIHFTSLCSFMLAPDFLEVSFLVTWATIFLFFFIYITISRKMYLCKNEKLRLVLCVSNLLWCHLIFYNSIYCKFWKFTNLTICYRAAKIHCDMWAIFSTTFFFCSGPWLR